MRQHCASLSLGIVSMTFVGYIGKGSTPLSIISKHASTSASEVINGEDLEKRSHGYMGKSERIASFIIDRQ